MRRRVETVQIESRRNTAYSSLQRGSFGPHIGRGAEPCVEGLMVIFFDAGAVTPEKVPASIKPAIATKRVFFMFVPLVIDLQICLSRFGRQYSPKKLPK